MTSVVPRPSVANVIFAALLFTLPASRAAPAPIPLAPPWNNGGFRWQTGPPVIAPVNRPGDLSCSIKDPTVVFEGGRWHVFATVRSRDRSHCLTYLSFTNWATADAAPRHWLTNHAGFHCAPQVFRFTPHQKWYLLCQASDPSWEPNYQPAFATSDEVGNPNSWSPLQPLLGRKPANVTAWLDFWIICDAARAHLFFTSLNGRMWRAETRLADFPRGWSDPVLALQGDVFEASHTYALKGMNQYLTLIEAQNGHGFRYFKAYLADQLEGPWRPLAATKDQAFASLRNVSQSGAGWTDAISHGELLRAGVDERLEVDPAQLRFLFQGASNAGRAGRKYGEIPWQLGLLEPAP